MTRFSECTCISFVAFVCTSRWKMNADQINGLMGLLGVDREEEDATALPPNQRDARAHGNGAATMMGYSGKSQAPANMKVAVKKKVIIVNYIKMNTYEDADSAHSPRIRSSCRVLHLFRQTSSGCCHCFGSLTRSGDSCVLPE